MSSKRERYLRAQAERRQRAEAVPPTGSRLGLKGALTLDDGMLGMRGRATCAGCGLHFEALMPRFSIGELMFHEHGKEAVEIPLDRAVASASTTCPRCGRQATMSNTEQFQDAQGFQHLFHAISDDERRQILGLLAYLQSPAAVVASTGEVASEMEARVPWLGPVARMARDKQWSIALIVAVLAWLFPAPLPHDQALPQPPPAESPEIGHLADQLQQLVEELAQERRDRAK